MPNEAELITSRLLLPCRDEATLECSFQYTKAWAENAWRPALTHIARPPPSTPLVGSKGEVKANTARNLRRYRNYQSSADLINELPSGLQLQIFPQGLLPELFP